MNIGVEALLNSLGPVDRLRNDFQVGLAVDQRLQAPTNDGVVVRDQDVDREWDRHR